MGKLPSVRWPRHFLIVCTALLVLAWCLREDVQPDLYFHLAAGRRIWSEGLPHTNVFLAPHPEHAFVDHEWLFQAAVYPLYTWGGARLLSLLKALAVVGTLAALAANARALPRGRWLLIAAVTLLAGGRFVLRPEVLSFLGAALYLWALRRESAEGPSRATLVGLPVVQLVWSNCHGFSLIGPALVAVTLFARGAHAGIARFGPAALRARCGPAPQGLGRGLLLLVLTGVASLLNPYGIEAALYPFWILLRAGEDTASAGLNYQVVELMSPWRPELAARPEIQLYKAWLLAGPLLWGLAFWRGRARLEDLAAGGLLCLSSLAYLRNLPFAALGLFLPSALGLACLRQLWAERRVGSYALACKLAPAGLVLAGAALLLGARAVAKDDLHRNASYDARSGLGLGAFTAYPEAAAFWRENPAPGALFNNFGAGHYLIWAQVEPKPFICGNTDLYPRSLLKDYAELMRGEVPPDALLRAQGVSDVFLDHRVETPPALLQTFLSSPAWALVHVDRRCVILRRAELVSRGLRPEEIARAVRGWEFASEAPDAFPPTRLLRWLRLLPPRAPNPLHRLQSAQLLLHLGQVRAAEALAAEAQGLAPGSALVVQTLASIQESAGRPVEAARSWRELTSLAPEDPLPWVKLGLLALRRGELAGAQADFEEALRRDPGSALARQNLLTSLELLRDPIGIRLALTEHEFPVARRHFYLGVAAELEEDWERAAAGYGAAAEGEPTLSPAWARSAEVLGRLERWPAAAEAWRRLCALSPRDASGWRAYGRALRRVSDEEGALAAWDEAARVDPREVEALLLVGALRVRRREGALAEAALAEARRRAPEDPRVQKLQALVEALTR